VQETFLEAQRDFAQFRGGSEAELRAWLRALLVHNLDNLARGFRATAKRNVAREVAVPDAPLGELYAAVAAGSKSPSGQAMARERDEALRRALDRLPGPAMQVIRWRNYDRLPFAEIGRRLGRSAEAARKVWARALEELRQALDPHDSR
jgi:RNA polymerase sigma-70 factor (ECF subfamily)